MRHILSPSAALFHADCRDALRQLPDNSIDSCVTDPPYALVSIVKRFGSPNAEPAKGNEAYMRASAGFMGKSWDTGECAMDPTFWVEVLRVLKPGAHLVAFGASRGYHRMACAIEGAGFEIRDSLMWLYGTGFPKSHDVSRDVDKMMGGVRAKIRYAPRPETSGTMAGSSDTRPWIEAARERGYHETDSTVPATDAAREWEGWGTALKPAFEPIVLARKPLSEPTVAANVLKWRTGALNIGACRVGTEVLPAQMAGQAKLGTFERDDMLTPERVGRWPANVVHDGSDEVIGAFPNTNGSKRGVKDPNGSMGYHGGASGLPGVVGGYDDAGGSAARFFYSAKASKAELDAGRWPANVVHDGSDEVIGAFPTTGASKARVGKRSGKETGTFGEFAGQENVSMGHDDAGGSAARFFYSAKASKQDRNGSKHPTVKPISLMEWLCTLITPPGGTVLDPFAGSGTTGIAAQNKGFQVVLCEREAEYVTDIKARFAGSSPGEWRQYRNLRTAETTWQQEQ